MGVRDLGWAATSGTASAATGAETIVLDVGDYGVVQLPPGIEGASWLALCRTPGTWPPAAITFHGGC